MKFDKTYVPRTNLGGDYNVNIQYLYKADGSKLRKTYTFGFGPTNTQTATQTDYLDGFQYEATSTNGKFTMILKFVPTAEGYYDFEKNKYFYSYTDHLGNVRLSYFKNAGGSAEVLEENNFYPFGLKHEGYNAQTGNPSYNYQYNGKELQKETGWSDYGARMYMSDIGRWGVIDPLAETGRRFSPYNYAYNNPIRYIDPDGRKPMSSEDEERNIMQKNAPDGSLWFTYANGEHGAGGGDGMGDFFAQMNRRHGGGGGSGPTPKTFGETAWYRSIMAQLSGSEQVDMELPELVLSGYGRKDHWGGAISTYNINHGILYNGIAGMQAAWNYHNRPMDPMAWIRSDGGIRMMGGDMFGFSDLAGFALDRVSEDHPYLAMGLGVVGFIGLKKPGLAKLTEYELTSTAVRTALADRIGKRGFTEVGYQFQKHFSRGGDWEIPLGVTKNPAMYNQAGYKTFKEIWRAPGSFENIGGFIEKRLPDGRGIRFQENWKFKGFLD